MPDVGGLGVVDVPCFGVLIDAGAVGGPLSGPRGS